MDKYGYIGIETLLDLMDKNGYIGIEKVFDFCDNSKDHTATPNDFIRMNRVRVPERKKGKWYKPTGMMPPEHFGRHRCSECDEFAMHDWKHHKEQLTDFCPNCGADMRGKQNG